MKSPLPTAFMLPNVILSNIYGTINANMRHTYMTSYICWSWRTNQKYKNVNISREEHDIAKKEYSFIGNQVSAFDKRTYLVVLKVNTTKYVLLSKEH